MGLVRGSECSETRAVVFEKINLWVAGVDRTHFPTAGETAPHADSSQKSGLAKRIASHEHDGSRRVEAERKEEQRASGRPFLAEPELTTGFARRIRYEARRPERGGVLRGDKRFLARRVAALEPSSDGEGAAGRSTEGKHRGSEASRVTKGVR